jgi:putative ABC transport system permease protein
MDFGTLVRRSLTHYWRLNVAVLLGVATAVAVLSGALLVGHSVRASLADLVRQRLGATDLVVGSPMFFRERLAGEVAASPSFTADFTGIVPLIAANAVVTAQESGRRAGSVKVYGVDERFWRFHGVAPLTIGDREALLSPALAREIAVEPGKPVLVRVQRPSDIPLESLHSRKDDLGRTLRLTTRAIASTSQLGEFSLEAQQGDVLAVFVALDRIQETLEAGDRVNTLLVGRREGRGTSAALSAVLRSSVLPEDVGRVLRLSDDGREVLVG